VSKNLATPLEIYTQFWSKNLEGRHLLEDLGADVRIILKWIAKKLV
jgi:hypothetical protein